jgi:hypothetical protein
MPGIAKQNLMQAEKSQQDQQRYWGRVALRKLVGLGPPNSDDAFWLECNLSPGHGRKYTRLPIPDLPPDNIQERFTGMSGRRNLMQAFEFYNFAREQSGLASKAAPLVLDFGGGWGRISRFFLRDTKAENIWLSDVLSDSHQWLRDTGAKFQRVKNEPLPPVPRLPQGFDLIFAYSVFSHLSEQYFNSWINYLLSHLGEDGRLVFTSRGDQFIKYLPALEQHRKSKGEQSYLPPPADIATRYAKGEFQFYPGDGGGELSAAFYGEAFVPEAYIRDAFPGCVTAVSESVPGVDQKVFVLRASETTGK